MSSTPFMLFNELSMHTPLHLSAGARHALRGVCSALARQPGSSGGRRRLHRAAGSWSGGSVVSALLQLALSFLTRMLLWWWLKLHRPCVRQPCNYDIDQEWLSCKLSCNMLSTRACRTLRLCVWHVAAAVGQLPKLTCCAVVSCLLLLPILTACTSLLQVQQQHSGAAWGAAGGSASHRWQL